VQRIRTQIFEKVPFLVQVADEFEVSQDNYHHLKNVLRLKDDELIKVVINEQQVAIASVRVTKKQLFLIIQTVKNVTQQFYPVTSLCFAVCKSAQNEFICEKATELGIQNIIFWRSEHTGIKVQESQDKIKRMQKIVEGAACQSRQDYLPKIYLLDNIAETINFVKELGQGVLLYASLCENTPYLRTLNNLSGLAHIFIGPEGGFSAAENEYLAKSAVPFSLGPSVLKAETAAIVAIAQVQAYRRNVL